jgi:acyl-CoA reductase-like NAD-dependent aldehyde dehydrogenase
MVTQCPNWIAGREQPAHSGQTFPKVSPVTGETLFEVARSGPEDLQTAISAAKTAQPIWAETPVVKRGEILFAIADAMHAARNEIAEIVAVETGKSRTDALGETAAAIALCRQRLAGYKVPDQIRVTGGPLTLPRNPTGKIMRRELKKMV